MALHRSFLLLSYVLFLGLAGTTGEIAVASPVAEIPAVDNQDLLRRETDLLATTIKMFGAFVVVLAVFAAFILLVKKWGHLSPQSQNDRLLNVVEFRVLAHKTYVYVLEYGETRYLVSVGPHGTSVIGSPDTPLAEAPELASTELDFRTQLP